MVVTRDADFGLEIPGPDQDISVTHTVLGYVGGLGSGDLGSGTSGTTGLGVTLFDASGFRWDIQTDGNINDGTSDAYDGGLRHTNFPSFSSAQTEENGREIVVGPASIAASR